MILTRGLSRERGRESRIPVTMQGMTDPSPFDEARPGPPEGPSGMPGVPGVTAGPRRRGPTAGVVLGAVLGTFLFTLSVGLAFVAGVGADRVGLFGPVPSEGSSASSGDLGLIEEAWGLLHTQYVGKDELDSRKLAYAAISAMTEAVGDTGHTMFMTPDEYQASQDSLSGSYAGIGAQMDVTGGTPLIVGVFRDTPADRAGLRAGDRLIQVDGVDVTNEPLDVVVSKVRGEAGTTVTLTIERDAGTRLTVKVVREQIRIPTVSWAPVPGTTLAMIRLEQFSSGAGEAFRADLKAALATKPTGLILDLRENPGGYVNEAVSIASEFLEGGVVYRQRDAQGVESSTGVTEGATAPRIPLVVLVDGGTASAAEIVTGALQDPKRATVVGTTTFGTGTVLGTFELPDGSALRIGTVEWLTPKGRVIWHDGLSPDVTVTVSDQVRLVLPDDLRDLTVDRLRTSGDLQVLRAIEILLGKPL